MDAETYGWIIFDITRFQPHSNYPLIPVGNLALNRDPDNHFQEIEPLYSLHPTRFIDQYSMLRSSSEHGINETGPLRSVQGLSYLACFNASSTSSSLEVCFNCLSNIPNGK